MCSATSVVVTEKKKKNEKTKPLHFKVNLSLEHVFRARYQLVIRKQVFF